MNKTTAILLSSACCLSALAAIDQRWTCETSRVEPVYFNAYHGETLKLAAKLLSNGQPVTNVTAASFLWQTNGMGSAWWQTNATIAAGHVNATFTPAMDPGAKSVTFFFQVTDQDGSNYRPSGKLYLTKALGDNPVFPDIPPPGGTIDFSRLTLVNAPWATLAAAQSAVSTGVNEALNAVASESNRAERTYAKLADIPAVPSIAGLATTGEVAAAAAAAQAAAEQSAAATYQPLSSMADYAKLSDIPSVPSIAGLATTGEVAAAKAAAQAAAESTAASTYQPLSAMADYAKLSDIPAVPSIAGLATTGEVAAAKAAAQAAAESTAASTYQPLSGMADYARLSDIPAVPSIAGLATTGEVAAAAQAAQAAAESTAASTYQPLSAMTNYPQRHEVPAINLSGRDLTVNGNTVSIPLPGESGSVISDGTNAIDAAGNTYTNGVVSGKLRARNDRIWGEYGYSVPVSSYPGAQFAEWSHVGGDQDPNLWKFFFTYGGKTWSVYTYPPDPDWTAVELEYQAILTEDSGDIQYWQNGPISFARQPLFDRFALESQLPGGGDGSARPLPPYLHEISFDDTYPDDAAWYYALPHDYSSCSAVRDGGFLSRNYDWRLDDAAEFVVRVSAGPGRFASVGVANCGTNLTEQVVTSGKWSRFYKCLPGRTVDGINENGVACEVNVVGGEPLGRWPTSGTIHCMGAVRWVLDHATDAGMAASNLVEHLYFPDGFSQNFHWMIADERATYIVENGALSNVTGRAVMTNFPLLPTPGEGAGRERYELLLSSACCITNAWYTRAYSRDTEWVSEFKSPAEMEAAKSAWETYGKEALRGKGLWQTVHTSVYDIPSRTLRLAVQEVDDWYVFAVPSAGSGSSLDTNTVADIANHAIATNETVQSHSSQLSQLSQKVGACLPMTNEYGSAHVGWNGDLFEFSYGITVDASPVTFPAELDGFYFGNRTMQDLLDEKADAADLEPLSTDIAQAYNWSRNVYEFITGDSSCHFSATNYVIGSEATNRTRFAWADDMDALTVPSSMCLRDIRDGQTNVVWDARDWTVWYFNYRIAKYRAERATEDAALRALIAQRAPINWSSFTACGLTNPASTTTWFDTPSVVLSAGYAWQHQLDVGGVGYWCIEGNGFEVGGSGTNSTLKISDFEGNEVFKIRKGNAMLAPVTTNMTQSVGFDGEWFWCQMKCDAEPEGEFAIDLNDDFFPEGDTCPAVVREYEDRGGGVWRCYWKVKPGIQSDVCFGRFKVQVGSETTVEYSNAPTFPAIRFGNYKLEPVIPSGAHVGDTVTFKITEITQ